jgi:protein-tyrosine phosphatase
MRRRGWSVDFVNDALTKLWHAGGVKTDIATRELRVEVAYNIRHLGDYQTPDGRRMNGHDIVRSATLHRLTEQGIEAIAESGIRTIVDLRSDEERERDVTPDGARYGIRNIHAPVFQRDASPTGLAEQEFPDYGFVYQRFLEIGATAYRTLFETIAESEGGVLFHCAAGKDRTGVAAALLLELGGVRHEDIVADYRLTEQLLRPLVDQWLPEMKERGIDEERARALMAAPEEAIETAIETIRDRYDGAESYLRSIGVSVTALRTVSARMAGE